MYNWVVVGLKEGGECNEEEDYYGRENAAVRRMIVSRMLYLSTLSGHE